MDIFLSIFFPAVAVVITVIIARRIASHSFKCKHCENEFYIKWPRAIITVHIDNDYKLRCPRCKRRDWCKKQPKNPKDS